MDPIRQKGAVWLNETVQANETSEPFLFAGWPNQSAWIQNNGEQEVSFTFEVDKTGNGQWASVKTSAVGPRQAVLVEFPSTTPGEWIRLKPNRSTQATAHFFYSANDTRSTTADPMFAGLSTVKTPNVTGGLMYGLGKNRRVMGLAAMAYTNGQPTDIGYYELDGQMKLVRKEDANELSFIKSKFAIPQQAVTADESSVLIVDDKGRRWRLPLGSAAYTDLTNQAALRVCREVATERDLLNCHGTFYELPAENADGYAKMRPIASHNLRINDYASYRGLLVMTGLDPAAKSNPHIVVSDDKKAAVWAGAIDDLWKLGKPTGHGGPWKNSAVKANEASDPYLIGFYDQRSLKLSHKSAQPVTFIIEADPIGSGVWMTYKSFTVAPGKTVDYEFPTGFQARWIRFKTDKACEATTVLNYK